MSYSLEVRTPDAPQVDEILRLLALADVRCREHPAGLGAGTWPTGILHFDRRGVSSRGVELSYEAGVVCTRLVSLANADDWKIAYGFLAAFAAGDDTEIRGEDGTRATRATVNDAFHEVFVRETAAAVETIAMLLETRQGEEVRINGPVRDVVIGRRMMSEVANDPRGREVALIDRIRRIQYLEDEGFEIVEPVPLPGVSMSVWTPTKAQVFEETESVGVRGPTAGLSVPLAKLVDIVGDRFEWLDEERFALRETPEAELPALYERAALARVDPYKKTRAWWQFWKA